MQIRASNIQVAFAARHKKQRRGRIDHHPKPGHHDNRPAAHRSWGGQPPERFPGNPAQDQQQQDSAEERGQNGRPPEPIAAPGGGFAGGQDARPPGQQQAQHIAQVVSGVGHQRQRAGQHAAGRFHTHKDDIERHPKAESPVVVGGWGVTRVGHADCHGIPRPTRVQIGEADEGAGLNLNCNTAAGALHFR